MRLPISLSWMFVLAVAVAGCGPSTPDVPQATTTDFGRFEGDVVAVWDTAGRNMTLREDFAYIDSMGRRWLAPAGTVVDVNTSTLRPPKTSSSNGQGPGKLYGD